MKTKAITIAKAKKLKPGTWVRVRWDDCEEDAIVLINYIVDGDKEIKFFSTQNGINHLPYDRIIKVGNQLTAKHSGLGI